MVELASWADFGDRDDEWVRDMFTAHMSNEKIAERLLTETRSRQVEYENAIRREKDIEPKKTMKTNPFEASATPIATFKQHAEEVVAQMETKSTKRAGEICQEGIIFSGEYNTRGQ